MSILFPSTNPFDPPNLPFIRRCCTACAKTSQTGVCGSRSVLLWVCFLVPFRCFISFMCVTNADWLLLDDELNFFLHIQRDICTYHTIKHCIYHHYPAARGLRGPFLKCCEMIYIVKWSSTCTTPAFVITKWVLKQQSREYMTHGLAMSRWEVAVLPKSYKHNSGPFCPMQRWQIMANYNIFADVWESARRTMESFVNS